LQEQQVNARIYQDVGLYIAEDVIAVDVNHLIGLESNELLATRFEKVEGDHGDQFLVETQTYEVLQYNFDTHLIEHNDFKMAYQTANEFVQKVLAMHLETNTSFPQDTRINLVEPDKVSLPEDAEAKYAMLINEELLYAFDGE